MLGFHMLGALAWAGTAAAQALQIDEPPKPRSLDRLNALRATCCAIATTQPVAFAYTCDNGPCTIFIRPSDDPATTLQSFAGPNTGAGSVTHTPGNTALSFSNFASNAATQEVFSGLTGW
ncbi:BQ2448_7372 [Microbotryum intermedium]|uniref:BQ2448_7372 protein n=1 Tax=Microbotryum intermedium TaxID=269621 RepID=A0A238FQS6_9BASI|nr:BQ2448_7372 [Microbotryum intermedium]